MTKRLFSFGKTLAVSLAIFSSTAAAPLQLPPIGGGDEAPSNSPKWGRTSTPTIGYTPPAGGRWRGAAPLTGGDGGSLLGELADRIQLHGYAQGGFNYNHKDGTDQNTFDLKRVLFWANAQITDRWSFLFMHDFSSVVQEYYTDYRFTKNKALTVRLGQFKNGLSIENPLSPTSMEAIDVYSEGVTFLTGCGSDPLMGVQYGRDLGMALFGETNDGRLRYELDVLNGQGINKKDGNAEKDFIARLEYRPLRGLNLVATGQLGRGHAVATSLYNPTIQIGDNYKRDRLTVGFDYKSKGLNLHGEWLEGWDGSAHSRGGYVTGNVPLGRTKVDLVGSYDFFNFNTDLHMHQHKAIAGLQYWFYGKCRIQLQYVYKNASTAGGQFHHTANHAVMCQMQVRFN
ncbi:MAG: porin [Bacteroidaceae bacterium]|nr:porin [Bacteroidaceae bacterium]